MIVILLIILGGMMILLLLTMEGARGYSMVVFAYLGIIGGAWRGLTTSVRSPQGRTVRIMQRLPANP